MARYHIDQKETAVSIELTDLGTHREQFIEALEECQEGRCSCPTDGYEKLESMELHDASDGITVRLVVKPGENLDASQIESCFDYTSQKLGRDQAE